MIQGHTSHHSKWSQNHTPRHTHIYIYTPTRQGISPPARFDRTGVRSLVAVRGYVTTHRVHTLSDPPPTYSGKLPASNLPISNKGSGPPISFRDRWLSVLVIVRGCRIVWELFAGGLTLVRGGLILWLSR